MKRLTILCLFMMVYVHTMAQQAKPTKEETIKFIANTIKGSTNEWGYVSEVTFDDEVLEYKNQSKRADFTTSFRGFKWQNLIKVFVDSIDYSNDCIGIELVFSRASITRRILGNRFGFNISNNADGLTSFYVACPAEKKKSMEKAFLRLKEIFLTENKDPFEN